MKKIKEIRKKQGAGLQPSYPGYIYLFIYHIPYPTTAGSVRNNAKKRNKKERTKKKRIRAQGETILPHPGNWCANGERRKEEKAEGRTKQGNRERYPATGTIWSPLTTRMDHTVGQYWNPPTHRGIIIIIRGVSRSRQHSRHYITVEHSAVLKIRHEVWLLKIQSVEELKVGDWEEKNAQGEAQTSRMEKTDYMA